MNILVYDSGVGGRSVYNLIDQYLTENNLHELVQLSYFADTANYPYGTKTEEELKSIVFSNLEHFKQEGFDQVVVACNTASSVIEKEPQHVPVPTITIIKPTVDAIVNIDPTAVQVIASNFTANNHVYSNALHLAKVNGNISEHGEQTLINAIEADEKDSIQNEISRIVSQVPEGAVFLWGCTHFSLYKDVIYHEMQNQGKTNQVVDPADELAHKVIEHLQNQLHLKS